MDESDSHKKDCHLGEVELAEEALVRLAAATRDGAAFGFRGVITISQNRAIGSPDPATPGANPLCKQRIVTPIPVDITPSNQGSLELRVAPEVRFDQVDFAQLRSSRGIGLSGAP